MNALSSVLKQSIKLSHRGRFLSSVAEPEALKNDANLPRHWTEIPGFKNWPLVGGIPGFFMHKGFKLNCINDTYHSLAKEFGPIVRINNIIGATSIVVLTDPKDIEVLLRSHLKDPAKAAFTAFRRAREITTSGYFHDSLGLLLENHEPWARVRTRVQAPMLKMQNIHQYLPMMDQISQEFSNVIAKHQKDYGEMPENFLEEIYKWALESVGLVALDKRLGCLKPGKDSTESLKMIRAAGEVMEALANAELNQAWRYVPTPWFRKLKEAHKVFFEVTEAQIKAVGEVIKNKDLEDGGSTLMEIYLKTPGLSEKNVVAVMLDLFFAGIDTTSHTASFFLYLLSKNPTVQRKLQEEIDNVIGDGREPLTVQHLNRLSYLKNCLKETLRIFPVAFRINRLLQEDLVLGGYLVPKGWQAICFCYTASHDEKYFPKPEEFIPERWERTQPLGAINQFASLPFSYGTRMCIGRRIAEQELYTLFTRLLHRFNVHFKHGEIEMHSRFIGIPSKPLRFSFEERRAKI